MGEADQDAYCARSLAARPSVHLTYKLQRPDELLVDVREHRVRLRNVDKFASDCSYPSVLQRRFPHRASVIQHAAFPASKRRSGCELTFDLLSSRAMALPSAYPSWKFYPSRTPAPEWVAGVVNAFGAAESAIDSRELSGVSSDTALAAIRPALLGLGFEVEASKLKADKITRPVLFGEQGGVIVQYDVDAFHPGHGIVLEVEAGRGAASNADYRDIVRASLMVDVRYLILAVMLQYRGGGQLVKSYEIARDRIDAIYASERLTLPLDGLLLVGY